ncbi:unnamed protein product, partial [Linum tenue]
DKDRRGIFVLFEEGLKLFSSLVCECSSLAFASFISELLLWYRARSSRESIFRFIFCCLFFLFCCLCMGVLVR